MHVEGSANLRPFVRQLLKACNNKDPPKKQQRAITPKLLRAMFNLAGGGLELLRDTHQAIIAELAVIGFFYAMRSCELTNTPTEGRTKVIRLRGVKFRNKENDIIPHSSPEIKNAEWVTVTFENQKNGMKMVSRTHQRSGDPVLCPVIRLASVVERIYRRVPKASPDTSIDTIHLVKKTSRITDEDLRKCIRTTCTLAGGEKEFGFSAADLGTRSIRSGAAMVPHGSHR